MTLSEELEWRGFKNQTTIKDLTVLDKEKVTFYFGADPSADSLTIGNLAAGMMLRHFIDHGHKAILLVGGATGMIGDPDGKKQERDLRNSEVVENNTRALAKQYDLIFDGQEYETVNNADWFKDVNYVLFLHDIGKVVPMSMLLDREFVKSRLGEDGTGISYAEFSYALMQAYDFLYLNRQKGVTLQLCGSDQWGNSILGVEIIRRLENKESHVYSCPLVINKTTGVKFGKSEEGAIWLDAEKTSPFKFYQFWLNTDDLGVPDYLKIYTLLSREEIESILEEFNDNKAGRLAQKTLAYEVTKLIHGEQVAKQQKKIAKILFEDRNYQSLTSDDLDMLSKELPFYEVDKDTTYVEALVNVGLAPSKRQAREFIANGAIYANNIQVTETEAVVGGSDTILGYQILTRGKKNMAIVKVNN